LFFHADGVGGLAAAAAANQPDDDSVRRLVLIVLMALRRLMTTTWRVLASRDGNRRRPGPSTFLDFLVLFVVAPVVSGDIVNQYKSSVLVELGLECPSVLLDPMVLT
jgi:hypothetical protein